MLTRDRHRNLDFFIADIWSWTLKDDQASMEHPFFSLSKNPDTKIRSYSTQSGIDIQIIPSSIGMPTIWDKDILIYCCSQLIEGVRQGREPKPSVQFELFDFLASTNRSTGKNGYLLAEDALKRLYGVSIVTNIETGGKVTKEPFRLI